MEGELLQKYQDLIIRWKKVYVYLKNGSIILEYSKNEKHYYSLCCFSSTFIIDLISLTGKKNAFEISNIKNDNTNYYTSFTFCAKSIKQRDNWINIIDKHILSLNSLKTNIFNNPVCFFKIIEFLPLSDIISCMYVCKQWKYMLERNNDNFTLTLWKNIALHLHFDNIYPFNQERYSYDSLFYKNYSINKFIFPKIFTNLVNKWADNYDTTTLQIALNSMVLNKAGMIYKNISSDKPRYLVQTILLEGQEYSNNNNYLLNEDQNIEEENNINLKIEELINIPSDLIISVKGKNNYEFNLSVFKFIVRKYISGPHFIIILFPIEISQQLKILKIEKNDKSFYNWLNIYLIPQIHKIIEAYEKNEIFLLGYGTELLNNSSKNKKKEEEEENVFVDYNYIFDNILPKYPQIIHYFETDSSFTSGINILKDYLFFSIVNNNIMPNFKQMCCSLL